jgi:hypothetical protein
MEHPMAQQTALESDHLGAVITLTAALQQQAPTKQSPCNQLLPPELLASLPFRNFNKYSKPSCTICSVLISKHPCI